jgi:hypothetical protein
VVYCGLFIFLLKKLTISSLFSRSLIGIKTALDVSKKRANNPFSLFNTFGALHWIKVVDK